MSGLWRGYAKTLDLDAITVVQCTRPRYVRNNEPTRVVCTCCPNKGANLGGDRDDSGVERSTVSRGCLWLMCAAKLNAELLHSRKSNASSLKMVAGFAVTIIPKFFIVY